ncbi:ParR family transcriptional regulator [Corynebacterium kutscheri]|uniref:ParR family transcriptional regulator n=1 Tax=Corynebacterium kutscheri TaxID=35755 RepID=A0A0F6QY75_9CORY|nr:PadR family transcriptional regulator [Corynebacterium kutscheri]AKE40397.1 transcriptional regulator, PadR family [Corynebacterium kutscheri]VEH05284.1 ParR family transcriptional regulator [Corynebacterium kutscheri]VEH10792.1 ParR family transcriptional regulator [Corynebacterium kutscheri]VEH80729.1 ParR family transcriptional regulator [Corynebacterium kutscheri]
MRFAHHHHRHFDREDAHFHGHEHHGRGHGHRGKGRGRGGRAGKGDLRAVILYLLSTEAMHGYQIITTIAEKTQDNWTPSPGAIYPTLAMLEDEGLITITTESGRKLATITEAGAQLVAENANDWSIIMDRYHPDNEQARLAADEKLHAAFKQLMFLLHETDSEKALTVLNQAIEELKKS